MAVTAANSFAFVTIRFDSTSLGGGADYVYNGNNHSSFAGLLNFTNLTANVPFTTICVDLDHTISGGSTYNANLVPTLGDPTFEAAGSVYAHGIGSVATNGDATALQLAVWAARYGCDLNTNTGGTFQVSSSWATSNALTFAEAQGYFNAGMVSAQDAIRYAPDPEGSGQAQLGPVPEPVSLLALGVALSGVFRKRFRKG